VIPFDSERSTVPPTATAEVAAAQVADQFAFLARWLPPAPARILDAGCGRGHLASALGRAGYAVTAVDSDPEAVTAARALGLTATVADIARYEDDPFDAVLFSLSLHHVADLAGAVERARTLLRPGGILLVDEFAWERAGVETVSWFHDMDALLGGIGLLTTSTDGAAVSDPYARWISRHRDEHRLHSGAAVVEAVAAAFDIRDVEWVPYLHRYLGDRLIEGSSALPAFTALKHIERQRVAAGGLAAVGFRLLAQPRQGEDSQCRAL
jgi:SAM-dependent methyltransferase